MVTSFCLASRARPGLRSRRRVAAPAGAGPGRHRVVERVAQRPVGARALVEASPRLRLLGDRRRRRRAGHDVLGRRVDVVVALDAASGEERWR